MVPFPEGKGEPTPETEQIFLAGENLRVFKITILIIHHAFHHGFGNSSQKVCLVDEFFFDICYFMGTCEISL
jgi:hypothetical protein